MTGEQTSKVQNAPTAAWLDVDKSDLNFGSLAGKLRLGQIPPLHKGYSWHCIPPVGPGAKPQPESILVNFRTKMKLYGAI